MANIDRVKKAIAVMTRVRDRGDNLNMCVWQGGHLADKKTEQELHTCGTAACFAGWLAVSPEFQAEGGSIGRNGCPVFEGGKGSRAIALYLEIPVPHADLLCMTASGCNEELEFYGVNSYSEITPQMVINKLQELKSN